MVILGGPIGNTGEDVALLAVEGVDQRDVRSKFSTYPWAASQVLRIKEIRSWKLWLDGRQR